MVHSDLILKLNRSYKSNFPEAVLASVSIFLGMFSRSTCMRHVVEFCLASDGVWNSYLYNALHVEGGGFSWSRCVECRVNVRGRRRRRRGSDLRTHRVKGKRS